MGNVARTPSVRPIADDRADADAATRILGAEGARAYRRFLGWSVGRGFKLAVLEVAKAERRDALVAWTAASYPGACRVALDEAEQTALIPLWKRACAEKEGGAQVLLLTHLDEAQDRIKLCARLNAQRAELTRAFPLPWVVLVHPSTGLDLQQIAPDFSDLVWLWLREEVAPRPATGAPPGPSLEPQEGDGGGVGPAEGAPSADASSAEGGA